MASRLLGLWRRSLQQHPVLTNTAVYATFYTAAELSQQTFNKIYSEQGLVWAGAYLGPRVYHSLYATPYQAVMTFGKDFETVPEKPELDFAAAGRIVSVGSTVYAPTLYFWYKFLDKKFAGNALKAVATKVCSDQFLMTPVLLATFFTLLGVLERREDVLEELRDKYWKTFVANQTFWIPAQTINFFFMPPHLRVVYVASTSFIWINVLCFIKRQKSDKGTV